MFVPISKISKVKNDLKPLKNCTDIGLSVECTVHCTHMV